MLLGVSAFPGKTYNEVLAQNRASCITFEGDEYKALDPQALGLLKRMLKKNPSERITAAEALNHPYFAESMEGEEVDVVPELMMMKSMTCDSPLLTSSNPARRNEKIKKDSCVDFKMGKENVFTGKVETLTETGSTANSVGKRFESVISPKISKFTVKR
jgi:serine/threonine protein kinase